MAKMIHHLRAPGFLCDYGRGFGVQGEGFRV